MHSKALTQKLFLLGLLALLAVSLFVIAVLQAPAMKNLRAPRAPVVDYVALENALVDDAVSLEWRMVDGYAAGPLARALQTLDELEVPLWEDPKRFPFSRAPIFDSFVHDTPTDLKWYTPEGELLHFLSLLENERVFDGLASAASSGRLYPPNSSNLLLTAQPIASVNAMRRYLEVCLFRARDAFLHGNLGEACRSIEYVRALIRLHDQHPLMFSRIQSLGARHALCEAILLMIRDGIVADERALALLADQIAMCGDLPSLVPGIESERIAMLNLVQQCYHPELLPPGTDLEHPAWKIRSWATQQQVVDAVNEFFDVYAQAVDSRWWNREVSMRRTEALAASGPKYFKLAMELLEPGLWHPSHMRDYVGSIQNGTQIIIAVERFGARYGKYPRDLAELVPEFLGHVPADPIVPDGEYFFRPLAEGREYLLYSVGVDQIDNGGNPGEWSEEAFTRPIDSTSRTNADYLFHDGRGEARLDALN